MDAYPCQRDLSPYALLGIASMYLSRKDFGAVLFYASFVAGLPELDGDSQMLVASGKEMLGEARGLVDLDLAGRLEEANLVLRSDNYLVMFQEHSPHSIVYYSLLRRFGADY